MPGFIKSKSDEKMWARAKRIAAKQGKAEVWPLITHIFQSLKRGHSKDESVDNWVYRMGLLLAETSLVSSPPDQISALGYSGAVMAMSAGREPHSGEGHNGEFPPPQDPRNMDARTSIPPPPPSVTLHNKEAEAKRQTPKKSLNRPIVQQAVKGIAAAQAARKPDPGAIVFQNESADREFKLTLVENSTTVKMNKTDRGNIPVGTTKQFGNRGDNFIMTPQGWKYMSVKERTQTGAADGSMHAKNAASDMEGPSSHVSRGLAPHDAVKALVKHIKNLKPKKLGPVIRGSKRKPGALDG